MAITITLSGPEEAFLRAEMDRLGMAPQEVVALLLRTAELAGRSMGTPQGRRAAWEAQRALRAQR